jgi:hypothetical protein
MAFPELIIEKGNNMKKLIIAAMALMLASPLAFAGPQQEKMKECNANAKTQDLKGDARKAFMKDCLSAKAPEEGGTKTAQQSRMTQCNKEAGDKGLKGDERKAFMSSCLSGKEPEAVSGKTTQQNKMALCNKEAGDKALKGDERKKFMSDCLKN